MTYKRLRLPGIFVKLAAMKIYKLTLLEKTFTDTVGVNQFVSK